MDGLTPICKYCGKFSVKVTGKEIYPHRPDLHGLTFYQCGPCDAYVGTHKGTDRPLGRLANKELRKAKQDAHYHFDTIWRSGEMKRKAAYKWLAGKLGIDPKDCHIGEFDEEQCYDVVNISEDYIFCKSC